MMRFGLLVLYRNARCRQCSTVSGDGSKSNFRIWMHQALKLLGLAAIALPEIRVVTSLANRVECVSTVKMAPRHEDRALKSGNRLDLANHRGSCR